MSDITPRKQPGQRLLLGCFGLYFAYEGLVLSFLLITGNTQTLMTASVRTGIALCLFVAMYRGANWARNAYGILLGLGLALGGLILLANPRPVMAITMIVLAAFFYVVALSRSVREFQAHQRARLDE